VQNSLDSSVIPKAALAHMSECIAYACGRAFGIVAYSETLRHDEAPNLSLLFSNQEIGEAAKLQGLESRILRILKITQIHPQP